MAMIRRLAVAGTGVSLLALAVLVAVERGDGSGGRRQAGRPAAAARHGNPQVSHPSGQAGWWSAVRREIARSEYAPSLQPADARGERFADGPRAHFVNRAQGLRAYFDERGVALSDREMKEWSLGLRVESVGRLDAPVPVVPTAPVLVGEKIVYERGWGREWYENRAAGIEQLFEVRERPAGQGPLRVVLQAEGLRIASARADGVTFATDSRDALAFGKLAARDAEGRALGARMEWSGGGELALVVDDARAAYPVLIDPLASLPAWAAEGNQADAFFGGSVGTAGDVNGDGFSDVIVGAGGFDNGQPDEGRAYVYLGSAAGLSFAPAWIAESNNAGAALGGSVGTAGDVNGDGFSDVIVGAPFYTNGESAEGRAFVYLGSAVGLSPNPAWTAESSQASAHFGVFVGTAGTSPARKRSRTTGTERTRSRTPSRAGTRGRTARTRYR
jgi:hypothetical protein